MELRPGNGWAEASANDDDAAVETLTAILRDYGHYAFDVEKMDAQSTNETCEKWARHLLYGAESPRATRVPGEPTDDGRRDWLGARHFLLSHRKREYAYVTESVGGMRYAIWTFVHELQQSMSAERESDRFVAAHIKRLDAASRQPSIEVMRREVAATAAGMSRILAKRREKESERVEALRAQITQLGSQLEEARQEGSLDPLTRLFNRKILDAMLDRAMDLRAVFGKETCLVMIDADRFKAVNDTYGHATGDTVLKSLANCLTMTFPRKGDVAARYGGEEFVLLLPDADIHDGKHMAERLLAAVRALRIDTDGKDLRITVSVGVTAAQAGDTVESWVQRADRALYRAKQSGRDRVVVG